MTAENREVNGPQLYLPANVLVKWQRWREWTDDATQESWVEFSIRFSIIPNALIERCHGIPSFDPQRSFFQYTVTEGQTEVASLCYPFVSYSIRVRKDDGRALRDAVEKGTVVLAHHVEGTAAAIADSISCMDGAMPFYAQIMRMIAFVNEQYPHKVEEQRIAAKANYDETRQCN